MSTTKRDQVWLAVIDALRNHNPIQTDDITENVDVSAKTARAVLGVAEDEELLRRESPRAQTWYPNIGPLGEVDDSEYQRLILDLLAESNAN